jgi:hypothetical protein
MIDAAKLTTNRYFAATRAWQHVEWNEVLARVSEDVADTALLGDPQSGDLDFVEKVKDQHERR